jgi:hypothetical protein
MVRILDTWFSIGHPIGHTKRMFSCSGLLLATHPPSPRTGPPRTFGHTQILFLVSGILLVTRREYSHVLAFHWPLTLHLHELVRLAHLVNFCLRRSERSLRAVEHACLLSQQSSLVLWSTYYYNNNTSNHNMYNNNMYNNNMYNNNMYNNNMYNNNLYNIWSICVCAAVNAPSGLCDTPVSDQQILYKEHLASFREHLASFREHFASFREHLAFLRERLASHNHLLDWAKMPRSVSTDRTLRCVKLSVAPS